MTVTESAQAPPIDFRIIELLEMLILSAPLIEITNVRAESVVMRGVDGALITTDGAIVSTLIVRESDVAAD